MAIYQTSATSGQVIDIDSIEDVIDATPHIRELSQTEGFKNEFVIYQPTEEAASSHPQRNWTAPPSNYQPQDAYLYRPQHTNINQILATSGQMTDMSRGYDLFYESNKLPPKRFKKPPFLQVTAEGLLEGHPHGMLVKEICEAIKKRYSWFSFSHKSKDRSCIRNKLSTLVCFEKCGNSTNSERDHQWRIAPQFVDQFLAGDFTSNGCNLKKKNRKVNRGITQFREFTAEIQPQSNLVIG
ncbi:uncharacterized protein [Watersipora subatra]|uniref:uncharacterized protein n=1 Tax=Watersipora subatra TaxID=2589382 RepID=UPI00355BB853